MYTTNNKNEKLNAYNAFRNEHGTEAFSTTELASEYARLYCAWWGSNLVFLGITEREGKFYPGFNVYD